MSVTQVVALEQNGPYEPMDISAAELLWAKHRMENGFVNNGKSRLVKVGGNTKIGFEAATLSLSAGAIAENGLCVNSKTCESICVVNASGRGRFNSVRHARDTMTTFLLNEPEAFGAILKRDLLSCVKRGVEFVRLNVNSDVAFEKIFPWLAEINIKMYDYSKRINRVGQVMPNYKVTYSVTQFTAESVIRRILAKGNNVAAVFAVKKHDTPDNWRGMPVLDGDITDVRYTDLPGHIVGLSAKGKLKGLKTHPLILEV